MNARILIAALAAASLAACVEVGPNYTTPPSAKINDKAARGAFLGAADAPVAQAPLPDHWWRLYDDPRLDSLIAQALSANTDLRVAAANLEKAEDVAAEVADATAPVIGAQAAIERAQVSAQNYLLFTPVPVENLGLGGVKMDYQLDLFGKLKRAAEAADADAQARAAALDLAKVSVAAAVARAYVDACSAGQGLAAAQDGLQVQERTLAAVQRLALAGRDSQTDVVRAEGLVAQAKAAPPAFEARRRAALYQLATLTGQPPADFPRDLETCAAPPRLSRPIPVGDGAALLRRRPDVREAERTLAAASARIGVATAALYPDVSLGLGVGTTGILQDLGQQTTNYWSAGPLISWTLPTAGARARIRAANADSDAALAHFDGVVLTALRETETSLTVYARDLDRNAALRAAHDAALQSRTQAAALLKAGRSPYQAGLDADRVLASTDEALAASDAQVADDQVSLFLALGGGWTE
jgi:NodT family efflux transporter outer membrane factor (OMF) lipoprotein